MDLSRLIPQLSPYQHQFAMNPCKEFRAKRAFDWRTLLRVMSYLVSGGNSEGAGHALMQVFNGERERAAPSRSALCQIRQSISWKYFSEIFYKLLGEIEGHRTEFRGLRIYAIDCQQLQLPRTADLRENGFNGRALEDGGETHMLRGYLSHCYDVLTGVSKAVTFHNTLNEHRDRGFLLKKIEPRSLVIYDALHFSENLAREHFQKEKCYFIARCKSDATREVTRFQEQSTDISSTCRYGRKMYFIRVKRPNSAASTIYAVHLPEDWLKPDLIQKLYERRWAVETSFLELTGTFRLEQWHSQTLNGILQELFCLLWLFNFTRILMSLCGEEHAHPLAETHRKSNFKLCVNFVVRKLGKYWHRPHALLGHLIRIVKQSTEKRTRMARGRPRTLMRPRSPYPHAPARPWGRDPPLRQTAVVPG